MNPNIVAVGLFVSAVVLASVVPIAVFVVLLLGWGGASIDGWYFWLCILCGVMSANMLTDSYEKAMNEFVTGNEGLAMVSFLFQIVLQILSVFLVLITGADKLLAIFLLTHAAMCGYRLRTCVYMVDKSKFTGGGGGAG